MKVTLVTNIPTPYRIPLWKALKALCDLQVICIAKSENNRQWQIDNTEFISFLSSYQLPVLSKDWHIHFTLPLELFIKLYKHNPDVIVITGYDAFAFWEALFYAKLFRKKSVFWNGSTLLSSRSRSKLMHAVKRFFIKQFDTYYTYGSLATKNLESFGVAKEHIITGTNTVDTTFFKKQLPQNSSSRDMKKLLYVGQLLERKGLKPTIEALAALKTEAWSLTIIGEGEQKSELIKLIDEYELTDRIVFTGYKQKDEIIDYYYTSDILLMPSIVEVWGLVLNEALASGLFCLSSKYAGATPDLLIDGENGFIIDPLDIAEYTQMIKKALHLAINKQHIQTNFQVNPASEAEKLYRAIQMAITRKGSIEHV